MVLSKNIDTKTSLAFLTSSFWLRIGLFICSLSMAGCANLAPAPDVIESDVFEMVGDADRAYNEGRWREAERLYEKVTRDVPIDYYAWFRLANVQMHLGRLDSAIYNYKEAIKLNPAHAKTRYNLAVAYMLSAQTELEAAHKAMREEDPGKDIVQRRLAKLRDLVEDRYETAEEAQPEPEPAPTKKSKTKSKK